MRWVLCTAQQQMQSNEKKIIFNTGIALIALFIILRFINSYGDPLHWSYQKNALYTFLSFLNTTKYPPSLLYCAMTLGPAFIFLSLKENANGRLSKICMVYGRVPFFYYVLHFFIIHTLCMILFFATGHTADQIRDPNVPFLFRPATFGFDLWIVYVIWFLLVAALYKPSKWFGTYKAAHRQWWLSYV